MIDAQLIPLVAARFRALGEPARLALLMTLQGGERSVLALAQATGRSQPNVSQHLATLARDGLVVARREGRQSLYRVADPYISEICDAVCRGLAQRVRQQRALAVRLEQVASRPARGGRGRR